jgi:signal transduction histidine kinase
MLLAAVSVSVLLFVAFVLRYMLDVPELRRMTLEAEADDIAVTVRARGDPSARPQYRLYPNAYAFRVIDRQMPAGHQMIAAANTGLLPELLPARSSDDKDATGKLNESFGPMEASEAGSSRDRWVLTTREQVDGRAYWVQVAMIGDPDWRWRQIMSTELFAHVLVPVATIVPALTIAMLIATRNAVRPLDLIALHAQALGRAVVAGTPLTPLPDRGLPREFADVVAALNVTLAKLEYSLMQQKRFASDAAHELRTPLAVLRLQIAELAPGPVADRLDEELANLATLVNQLLRFAQAEEAMASERHPVDVVAAARKVCEDFAPVAVARNQLLEFDGPERAIISGHPALVDVAIRNIVDNAIRLSPPRVAVTVTVDASGDVIVEDRGPGVPDAAKERIFDRLWHTDRPGPGGTGLGLALVRRIAELHGGDVRVEDRAGGGARFVLRLARASATTDPIMVSKAEWPRRSGVDGEARGAAASLAARLAQGSPKN